MAAQSLVLPSAPDFHFERSLLDGGAARVAGVDEVGRGPLAGPVMAAAVRLDPDNIPPGLNDSKKLSPRRREALADLLWAQADCAVGEATVDEIAEVNILRAAHLAMQRAVARLALPPDFLLIDGTMAPKGLNLPHRTLVKGDARSLSIAAASIIAKVARDRIMADLAAEFPGYGWETNAGYPTPAHKRALQDLGVTPHHRRSFGPIHKMLCGENTPTH
ncbi:MAG: ribonuclease HII [Rhodobacteraceae bacterium]|nr:ribonuclease HII [Paracoccaceae bacterium]